MALERTPYGPQIHGAATNSGLDPVLVESIVIVESYSGQTDAFRFEPDFWRRYLVKKAEWKHRNPRRVSSSYGLMQIMYPTALEMGYPPNDPPELLFVPEVGLRWGCTYLKFLLDWSKRVGGDKVSEQRWLRAALASYNGGRGGNHPVPETTLLRNDYYAAKILNLFGRTKL